MELSKSVRYRGRVKNNNDVGFDMDLVVRILKIKEYKQLRHPLLGHPILTYSVSVVGSGQHSAAPWVTHCKSV